MEPPARTTALATCAVRAHGQAGKPLTTNDTREHKGGPKTFSFVNLRVLCGYRFYLFSFALRLICAFSSFETGQPAFAAFASSLNFASSTFGTRAFRSRSTLVMAQPTSFCSRLTLATVRISSAVKPFF